MSNRYYSLLSLLAPLAVLLLLPSVAIAAPVAEFAGADSRASRRCTASTSWHGHAAVPAVTNGSTATWTVLSGAQNDPTFDSEEDGFATEASRDEARRATGIAPIGGTESSATTLITRSPRSPPAG